jgi:hypothetical protein
VILIMCGPMSAGRTSTLRQYALSIPSSPGDVALGNYGGRGKPSDNHDGVREFLFRTHSRGSHPSLISNAPLTWRQWVTFVVVIY